MNSALYQSQQIQELESHVIQDQVNDVVGLMELAGNSAFKLIGDHWPQAKRIVVCCGKGNNGGDGYVLARLAQQAGLDVTIYSACDQSELRDAALRGAKLCEELGVKIQKFNPNQKIEADVIVDALLGIGLRGPVQEPYLSFIQSINQSKCPVLAIDVPSGLDASTGNVQGIAVKAAVTITFMALKAGLFTDHGPAYCGKVFCDSLGVPHKYLEQLPPFAQLLLWDELKHLLPRRERDAHKGNYGHVLVVGGDYGMGGAVRMAAEAALRVGAGLVSVATRPEHVPVVNCSRPEIMCHQVVTTQDLDPLLKKATVVVIGPGLGKSDWAKQLLSKVLTSTLPKVIDADGLNLLSESEQYSDQWVLTPHPGEAARLLSTTNENIQQDRFESASRIQKQYGGVVVLKGVGTVIKDKEACAAVCPAGNPGMASGGMGDVLSGVIGGLLAQKLTTIMAAKLGVLIHSAAADQAANEGGERGLLATDLMSHLRTLVNPY